LSNFGGKIGRLHLPRGGGIHEVRVATDEFRKRGFVAAPGVVAEQLGVGLFVHLTYLITAPGMIRQSFLSSGCGE
jgi:hypothetical protein